MKPQLCFFLKNLLQLLNFLILLLFWNITRCDGQPEVESQNSRYVNYAKASGLCRAKRLVWDRRDGEWNFHAISNSYHDNRGRQDDYVGAGGDTCFIIDPDK